MKHFFVFIAAALIFSLNAAGKAPQTVPGKICILVTDVGTIDTVAKTEEFLTKIKQFNIEKGQRQQQKSQVSLFSFALWRMLLFHILCFL